MQTNYAIEKLQDYNTKLSNDVRGDIATMISNMKEECSDKNRVLGRYVDECHNLRTEVLNLKTALNIYRNMS
jgi:hypothetical protein